MSCTGSDAAVRRVVVLGFGNDLRMDDGAGPEVVRRLQAVVPDPRINYLTAHQLVPELALALAGAARAVLLDADRSIPAGRLAARRLLPGNLPHSLGHYLPPEHLLALVHELGGRPRVTLYTLGAAALDLGTGLTPSVDAAAARVVAHLAKKLRRWLGQQHHDALAADP